MKLEADLVAAERADSFLEAGDVDGSAVWKRVLAAIGEIQREEPREGESAGRRFLFYPTGALLG